MATLLPTPVSVLNTGSSQRLLGAALAGLLCVATASCTSKQDASSPSGTAGAAGEPGAAGSGGTASGGSANTSGSAGVPASTGDSGAGGAPGSAGTASTTGGASDVGGAGGTNAGGTEDMAAGGAAAEPPHITSSMNVGVMTVEDFTTMCDKRGGIVEVMTHCGGLATAKGFSYDSTTQLLSEHTCAGANTCAGWNCAIKD